MKKLMLVAMVAIMSLGLLGVGYAMWQETLNITGTVGTGNVNVELSGPYIIEWGQGEADKPTIANCTGSLSNNNNTLTVTVDNAYPSYECYVVFDVHGLGSVPAHIHDPVKAAGPAWVRVVDPGYLPATTAPTDVTIVPATLTDPAVTIPFPEDCYSLASGAPTTGEPQLHTSNRVYCAIYIHFKNTDMVNEPNLGQNGSFSFTYTILGHQFNEEPGS